jgi:hypothetical protein
MYNIVLGIRGKQKSHELMGKNERKKYKIQSKAADLGYRNLFVCLIKKKRTFSNIFELVWS